MVQGGQQGANNFAVDAVVVGAGFAGMYMVHRLNKLGLSVICFEAGSDVGGTWYWNRFPGARCDIESVEYQYGFSDDLQRNWSWSERYATQSEILRYAAYVADRLDLRRHIQFDARVTSVTYDDQAERWTIETEAGHRAVATYAIMASGCLSASSVPHIPGIEDFQGDWYHTGDWPHAGVDFSGKRVAVIGTGSSGVQAIPIIAEQASELKVFQRTPNFSLPALNQPLDPAYVEQAKETFMGLRRQAERAPGGNTFPVGDRGLLAMPRDEVMAILEDTWTKGGFALLYAFPDVLVNRDANAVIADFLRAKIAAVVHDPQVADLLTPKDYPFGTKRTCLDTGYFETFNKPHVELVDVSTRPIERITASAVVADCKSYDVDAIVFATGFDAMTGSLLRMDIRGRDGVSLRNKWSAGPRTYLGLQSAGFPNLFMLTGPGSPSVLAVVIVTIEQHVEFVSDCIEYMIENGIASIEADKAYEDRWVDHVNDVAAQTLYMETNSWYLGANVPGKPRIFMPYVGGLDVYRAKCEEVVARGYEGFVLRGKSEAAGSDALETAAAAGRA